MEKATLTSLVNNFALLSLFLILFSLGLGIRFQQIIDLWKQPGLMLRAVVSAMILVPLIAVFVYLIFGNYIPPSTRIAIMLMGIIPSAPLIVKTVTQKTGKFELIASLQISLAFISIFSIPFTIFLLIKVLGVPEEWQIFPRKIAPQIFQAQILPLGLGLMIRELWSDFADDLQKKVVKIANGCFTAVLILILVIGLKSIWQVSSEDILSMVVMSITIIFSLIAGHFMGAQYPHQQAPLAIISTMRNTGLALVLVRTNAPLLTSTQSSIVTYALLTALFTSIYAKWMKKKALKSSQENA